jgi:ketosteroid isomerase-like protein
MWMRTTMFYRKVAGEWRITHEHVSVPFDMQSFKALLDLNP